jgi:flagellar secretion chaperone FliS
MQPKTRPAIAGQHYRMLELTSRVESASPHGLVGLLYEELLRALDLAVASANAGKMFSGNMHVTRALTIIVALEGSLDMEKGGDLAVTLARIYRACRQGIHEASRNQDAGRLSEIRGAISDIAYSWQAMSGA